MKYRVGEVAKRFNIGYETLLKTILPDSYQAIKRPLSYEITQAEYDILEQTFHHNIEAKACIERDRKEERKGFIKEIVSQILQIQLANERISQLSNRWTRAWPKNDFRNLYIDFLKKIPNELIDEISLVDAKVKEDIKRLVNEPLEENKKKEIERKNYERDNPVSEPSHDVIDYEYEVMRALENGYGDKFGFD